MSPLEYVIGSIIIVLALVIIAVVLLQEGRQSNMGAISGNSDSFMDRGRSRTLDAFLARWTKWLAIIFFVAVLVGMLVTKFMAK
ncbi:MAG: preprotein translocase subunit SecG [Clostridia bacterium]|nr:preprotein translocase subunit SecG [Clostridia bacterium]